MKEVFYLSDKERAIRLLDQIPESKMYYIIGVLEGAAIPNEEPNTETIEAIQELENGAARYLKVQRMILLKRCWRTDKC